MTVARCPAAFLSFVSPVSRLAAECFGERDVGGVVGAEVVPQFPHPGVVGPDRMTGDPQARVVSQHLLAAMASDLLPGGKPADC